MTGTNPQERSNSNNQPKDNRDDLTEAQSSTTEKSEDNEVITVDSTSTADDTSNTSKRTGDVLPKSKSKPPPRPKQQDPPKITAFQVTKKDTTISKKTPFIFESIPEATSTSTAL